MVRIEFNCQTSLLGSIIKGWTRIQPVRSEIISFPEFSGWGFIIEIKDVRIQKNNLLTGRIYVQESMGEKVFSSFNLLFFVLLCFATGCLCKG